MRFTPILILAAAGFVTACGGGGESVAGIDGRGSPPAVAGVVARGAITGFGSVIVNGVTYDTNSANFIIDGEAGTQADLAVGDVVVIVGTASESGNPVAGSVTFDDAVEGPISTIDATAETLVVLGQLVRVDAATSFDDSISPASLDGLAINDVVEVSGFFRADGSISATRIELKSPGGELEVTGIVSNAGPTTFEINGLVVDFRNATPLGFPNGMPENGQRVEARGDGLGTNGELLATEVELRGGELGEDGDEAEIEGFITVFTSASDFEVEGIEVMTTVQTAFDNGTRDDLAPNRKVEVEGEIDANGVLVAERIEFRPTGELRIESLVEDVQSDRLTVLGITIVVNAATRFEDDSVLGLDVFNLSNVAVDEYVEIRAYDDMGTITATLLERDDFDDTVALRGIAENVADPSFEILGVTIATDADTVFTDNDGVSSLSAAEFFDLVEAGGRLVEAKGSLNGSIIEADEVEFED